MQQRLWFETSDLSNLNQRLSRDFSISREVEVVEERTLAGKEDFRM